MRKFSVLFLVFFVAFTLNSFAKGVVVDKIVATVEGMPITAYELENISGFYQTKNTKELINRVVDDYIVEYYAKQMGIIITDEDVNRYIDNLAAQNGMSTDAFLQKIQDSGIDLECYKKGVRLGLYRRRFALKMFAPTTRISETDIERYYKLHKNEFKTNPILVMSIISVRDKKLAESIYSKLQSGVNFEFLKNKYSIDKEKTRAIPLSAFNKTIRSQLSTLNKGDISNIIEANGVYYIVKLVDKQGENISFDSLKNKIRNIIFAKRIEAKLSSWIKMVKARTDVEIFE